VVDVVRRAAEGVTLVEVLVALAVFGLAGGALLSLTSTGVRGTQRAEEWHQATSLGSRLMDRLLADGYQALAPRAGQTGAFDLTALGESASEGTSTELRVDGATFSAAYGVARRAPGLLAVDVTVSWDGAGAAPARPGRLCLLRYVGDPVACMDGDEAAP
jgi:prepilin-type N-terminal cleavage/methylation domain-containing protein